MRSKLNFDEARKLITVVAVGSASMESSLGSLRALRTDSRFRGDYRVLCNFLDSKYVPKSAERFALGIVVSAFFPGQKIALVVGNPEVEKLKELIAINTGGKVDANVFNDIKAAERWLMAPTAAVT